MFGDMLAAAQPFAVTMTYGSILAIIFVALSLNVGLRRGTEKIPFGPGDNDELLTKMRAQQNFAEYVPLALLLLAGLEANGADTTMLRVLGGSLVVARVLHAWGLIAGQIIGRGIGTLATMLVLLIEGIWGLVIVMG